MYDTTRSWKLNWPLIWYVPSRKVMKPIATTKNLFTCFRYFVYTVNEHFPWEVSLKIRFLKIRNRPTLYISLTLSLRCTARSSKASRCLQHAKSLKNRRTNAYISKYWALLNATIQSYGLLWIWLNETSLNSSDHKGFDLSFFWSYSPCDGVWESKVK
jgi:hypothetical protein